MKNLIYFISIILLFSCQKEEKITILDCEDNPRHGVCLNEEMIIDDSTQVPMFQPGNTEKGFVSGIKSNQPWEASIFSFGIDNFLSGDNFFAGFNTLSDEGFCRESIFLQVIPRKIGCYPLELSGSSFPRNEIPTISYTLLGDDGDVFIGSYSLNPVHRDSNLIEITEIDTINRKVYGRLAASFFLADTSINRLHPNFIRLFNCEIEATYE